jgi:chitinase
MDGRTPRWVRTRFNAANATAAQIGKLIPGKTAAQLRSLIGVAPMIGINDVPGETFTLTVAQTLLNDALGNGFGMLSMWAATRDSQWPTVSPGAQDTCGGVTQTPMEFSRIFKKFDP